MGSDCWSVISVYTVGWAYAQLPQRLPPYCSRRWFEMIPGFEFSFSAHRKPDAPDGASRDFPRHAKILDTEKVASTAADLGRHSWQPYRNTLPNSAQSLSNAWFVGLFHGQIADIPRYDPVFKTRSLTSRWSAAYCSSRESLRH